MDGNFKVEHMKPKNAAAEIWLMDGKGYMVTSGAYKDYLAGTVNRIEVYMHMASQMSLIKALAIRLQQSPSGQPSQCTTKPTSSDQHRWMCLCTS